MDITLSKQGCITIARPKARRLDAAVSVRFKDEMRAMADAGLDQVVLDMSSIEFMDSSGLGALVASMKYFGSEGCFEIAAPTPVVRKLFALTKMNRVFRIHQSLEDALEARENLAIS